MTIADRIQQARIQFITTTGRDATHVYLGAKETVELSEYLEANESPLSRERRFQDRQQIPDALLVKVWDGMRLHMVTDYSHLAVA